ncbi:MAG: S8 family serine peptidase [Alphaproteobacteria bacterium]|nr:S8 family serine peptidase [Alphaproteobacteria bacterium]
MIQRLIYGICCLSLVTYIGYKIWQDVTISPQNLVDAPHAHEHKLEGRGVITAVIDEGFDTSHASLKEHFSTHRYNTDNTTRDISETMVFENGAYKFESHGTHVTGIISSIAPQAKIIPIKMGMFGGDQSFVKALQMATSSPAHIVNISMRLSHTGREISPNVRTALIQLAKAGKLIVIAAGNESSPMMSQAYTASLIELAQDPLMEGCLLIVGASTYKNGKETLAEFSNYPGKGSFGITQTYFITAPGDKIRSTLTGGLFGEKSGTSMATPMVVGAASLIKEAFPQLQANMIVELLLKSARKTSLDGKELPNAQFGAGIVNIKSALAEGKTL